MKRLRAAAAAVGGVAVMLTMGTAGTANAAVPTGCHAEFSSDTSGWAACSPGGPNYNGYRVVLDCAGPRGNYTRYGVWVRHGGSIQYGNHSTATCPNNSEAYDVGVETR